MPKRRFHEESGASTIEGKNTLTGIKARLHHVEVRTLPLDAFGLTSVSVIKIDVEGHELAVLEGAVETIRGSRPAIFLEAEDRHRDGAIDSLVPFFVDSAMPAGSPARKTGCSRSPSSCRRNTRTWPTSGRRRAYARPLHQQLPVPAG